MSSDEETASAVGGTFTCESCGKTFPKGWSDEEAAAEAEEFFPGIDVSDPAEAGLVCDGCYEHIMARARVEAPELIGPGWRVGGPERPHCLPGCGRLDGHDGRDPGACMGWSLPLWPPGGIPAWCYRLASGSMVHVKPGCRC